MAQPHSGICMKGTVDGFLNTGISSEVILVPKRGIGVKNEAVPRLADAGRVIVCIGTKDSIHVNDTLSFSGKLPPNPGELRTRQMMSL